MEKVQSDEWYELRENTWRHLRERSHVRQPKYKPLLQLLVKPSFDDTWCVDFLESEGVISAFLTVWQSSKDIHAFATGLERLKHPRPFRASLESSLLPVTNDSITEILDRFGEISLPLYAFGKEGIYLDGTSFELQVGEGSRGIALWWSNDLPAEWSDKLGTAIDKLIGLVDHSKPQT